MVRVALRIFLDLDTAHTARLLGIASGTATAHMARAVVALRQELTPAPSAGTDTGPVSPGPCISGRRAGP
jgi:hypothetical protein